LKSLLWSRFQNVRVRVEDAGYGVARIRIRSRGTQLLGIEVNAFLVGKILIDTGFVHARPQLLAALNGRQINTICCTHHHEDHTGNCAILAEHHRCPVFLRRPEARWQEGMEKLHGYRRFWWGTPDPYQPEELPDEIESGGRRLRVVPAPGHSQNQVAFFEEASGYVFTGDLFVSPGASAVLIWEDPWAAVASLRRVAALRPRRMLTSHGLVVDDPVSQLEVKAQRIEAAAGRAVELMADGVAARTVVRTVFPNGFAKDRFFEWLTGREFSRLNFVLAAVRCARKGGNEALSP
jgi:glyoxylase-like metal-dependent hydrolase (beta-lactamase superfamily II)